MAWWTVSGACSRRSERRTWRLPSRRRMVVLSEVKRRKRMSSGGMGARGRSSRYCSSKIWTSGGWHGPSELNTGAAGFWGGWGCGREEGAEGGGHGGKEAQRGRLVSVEAAGSSLGGGWARK